MAALLISLRNLIAGRQMTRANRAAAIAALVLILLSAAGTLALGLVSYPTTGAAADVIALVFAVWLGGRLANCALTGEPTLRPELFALLPLRRRALARALLVANLADPALLVLAVPFAAVIAAGARASAAAAAVGVAGEALTLLLAGVAGTVAAGVLGPGKGRGHDTGTVVTALAISAVSVTGTLLPWLVATLRAQSAPWLTVLVRVLPSGWAPVAAGAAARSDWLWVVLPLAGLAGLTSLLALAWPVILTRRMTGAGRPRRAVRARAGHRALLPGTPLGAVAGKEMRLWVRDPIRLTTLLVAVVVGAAVCVIPRLTAGTTQLFPFAGAGTAVIAGACACNLYGNDGTSLWLTVASPGSGRADVRGRQLGWLLLVGPYTVALTLLLTALSGESWTWPWALGILAALLGGASGLAPLASLAWVVPLDAAGDPTPPMYSLKVHLALIAVALTAAPPVAAGLAGSLAGLTWLTWLAVPVGAGTGLLLAWWLGAVAARRLPAAQVGMLRVLTAA